MATVAEPTVTRQRAVAPPAASPPQPRRRPRRFVTPLVLMVPALGVLVWWMKADGGFAPTTWYPGGLILLGLLYVGLVALPTRPARSSLVAASLLFAYAAWSCASIAWADEKAIAWDGGNRTLVFAVVFALFALWPLRGRPAAVLVGGFGVAVAAVGLAQLLAAHPGPSTFIVGRLSDPVGDSNANVALWMMGVWPCVALGSRRELPPPLRGVLLAGATLLCGLALMGQSRGWLFVVPVAIAIFLAFSRDRVRTAVTLLVVAVACLPFRASVLHVYTAMLRHDHPHVALDAARRGILLSALVVGLAVTAVAYLDRRLRVSARIARRANRGFVIAAVIAVATTGVVFTAGSGDPFSRIHHAFEQFKSAPEPSGTSARLTETLGSLRYDFWRVAWKEFREHPIAGIGADNFQQPYLRLRHTVDSPRYPHSIELQTISQTGVIGTLLLLGALVTALAAAWRGARRRSGVAAAAAAAATTAFAYWLIHGSIDWFWQFPALSGAAFAMLGIAASLAPRRADGDRRLPLRPLALAAVTVCAAAIALSFIPPWLSAHETSHAAATWPQNPGRSLADLNGAASLNPLSPDPLLVRASIAEKIGRLDIAQHDFRAALRRDPQNSYATLELALIAITRHHHAEAQRLLAEASRLNPIDDATRYVRYAFARGWTVTIPDINRWLLRDAQQFYR